MLWKVVEEIKKDEKKKKIEHHVLHMVESFFSGYERRMECIQDFIDSKEDSHLLKHYTNTLRDIDMNDIL